MPSAPRRWQPPTAAKVVRAVAPAKKPLTACERGYDARWRKARESFLADHPLCERCEAAGLVVEATVVDHRTPHRGDVGLFWTRSNWAALCVVCHNKKTATEDRLTLGARPVQRYGAVPAAAGGEQPF